MSRTPEDQIRKELKIKMAYLHNCQKEKLATERKLAAALAELAECKMKLEWIPASTPPEEYKVYKTIKQDNATGGLYIQETLYRKPQKQWDNYFDPVLYWKERDEVPAEIKNAHKPKVDQSPM